MAEISPTKPSFDLAERLVIVTGGGQAIAQATDVSDRAASERMAEATIDAFGRIDGLVNNAALMSALARRPWHEIAVEEWDRVMAVNLRGIFLCCLAVYPQMKKQGKGKIVNIASSRVTRAGGTVAACGWDFGGGMDMLRLFWNAAVVIDPAAEPRHARHTPYGKKGQHAGLWAGSGLSQVVESELAVALEFASFDDFWSPFLSGSTPTSAYATSLPPERHCALRNGLREQLLGGGPDRPFALQARAWAVRGTVPQGRALRAGHGPAARR